MLVLESALKLVKDKIDNQTSNYKHLNFQFAHYQLYLATPIIIAIG